MLGSTTLQIAIAATLIALPLLHPERLSFHVETPLVFTPPPPRPPLRIVQAQQAAGTADTTTPSLPPTVLPTLTLIPRGSAIAPTGAPPIIDPMTMGTGMSLATGVILSSMTSSTPAVRVAPSTPPKRVAISSGVSVGLLLTPIRPVYPAIAKAAGISGTVVVEAVISRTGTVESLKVVSGQELLRAAALDAIRTARYKPYMLNGEPTEVQTTFTVNFRIGG